MNNILKQSECTTTQVCYEYKNIIDCNIYYVLPMTDMRNPCNAISLES